MEQNLFVNTIFVRNSLRSAFKKAEPKSTSTNVGEKEVNHSEQLATEQTEREY